MPVKVRIWQCAAKSTYLLYDAVAAAEPTVGAAFRLTRKAARRPPGTASPEIYFHALPAHSNVPAEHMTMSEQIWSPLTESNRRPSPYHYL
jgi:hypothetical protein